MSVWSVLTSAASNLWSDVSGAKTTENVGIKVDPAALTPLKVEAGAGEAIEVVDQAGSLLFKVDNGGQVFVGPSITIELSGSYAAFGNGAGGSRNISGSTIRGSSVVSTEGISSNHTSDFSKYGTHPVKFFSSFANGGGPEWEIAEIETTDGAATIGMSIGLDEKESIFIDADILAFKDSEDKACQYNMKIVARRAASGNVVVADTTKTAIETDSASLDVSAAADTGDQEVDISVIGNAAENWRWHIVAKKIKVFYS